MRMSWVSILFFVAGLLYVAVAIRDKWFPGFIAETSGSSPWFNLALGVVFLAIASFWHWVVTPYRR